MRALLTLRMLFHGDDIWHNYYQCCLAQFGIFGEKYAIEVERTLVIRSLSKYPG